MRFRFQVLSDTDPNPDIYLEITTPPLPDDLQYLVQVLGDMNTGVIMRFDQDFVLQTRGDLLSTEGNA